MELVRNKEGREENTRVCVAGVVQGLLQSWAGIVGDAGFGALLLSCVRTNCGVKGVCKMLRKGWGVVKMGFLEGKRAEVVFYLHLIAPYFTPGCPRP